MKSEVVGGLGILCAESVLFSAGWFSEMPVLPKLVVPEGGGIPKDLGDRAEPVPVHPELYAKLSAAAVPQEEVEFTSYGFRTLLPGTALALLLWMDPGVRTRGDLVVDLEEVRPVVEESWLYLGLPNMFGRKLLAGT